MSRLSVTLILSLCLMVCSVTAFAQDEMTADTTEGGGTLRGTIVDTTPKENPISDVQVKIGATDGTIIEAISDSSGEWVATNIPPGRYLVSIYRQGYGSREGKRVTVLPGGDQRTAIEDDQERHYYNGLSNARAPLLDVCPGLHHGYSHRIHHGVPHRNETFEPPRGLNRRGICNLKL